MSFSFYSRTYKCNTKKVHTMSVHILIDQTTLFTACNRKKNFRSQRHIVILHICNPKQISQVDSDNINWTFLAIKLEEPILKVAPLLRDMYNVIFRLRVCGCVKLFLKLFCCQFLRKPFLRKPFPRKPIYFEPASVVLNFVWVRDYCFQLKR